MQNTSEPVDFGYLHSSYSPRVVSHEEMNIKICQIYFAFLTEMHI